MEEKKRKFLNDEIDLDTLFVVFLNRIDILLKIFLVSAFALFIYYLADQRIYQSSTLIFFEQNNELIPGNVTSMNRSPYLSGEKQIYQSISTISRARDKLIQENVTDDIPSIGEIQQGLKLTNDSNLMTVTFKYTDKKNTQTILDYLNQEFLDDIVENKQLKAKKGIEFVNSEIPKISLLLGEAEKNLTEFVSSSGKNFIFDEKRGDAINILENRIKEIEFKEIELKEFYKPSHPIYSTLTQQKNVLKDELNLVEQSIKDLPSEERTLFNLQQKVNIFASSLETLEKQKLNLNLSAASSISNVRIVNEPSIASKISPKFSIMLLSFAALIIAYVYFLIDHFLTDKILSVDSLLDFLDDRRLFIGSFPLMNTKKKERTDILKNIEKNNLDKSAISLINTKDKINIVTSMKGGVGKTYFSMQMVNKLLSLGKRVCLVDFDLRKKGALSRFKNADLNSISFNDFMENDLDSKSYLINRPVTEDPIKFLSSSEINIFFAKLRQEFDHVIIDTSPMGTFIDSNLLSSKADSIILILASHSSTFGDILAFQKEISSMENEQLELKYFFNKVRYYLEIFRFKIRYPLYGDYGYYDGYYQNVARSDNSLQFSTLWKFTKFYFKKTKNLLINFLNRGP